jgi:hypothetical protein
MKTNFMKKRLNKNMTKDKKENSKLQKLGKETNWGKGIKRTIRISFNIEVVADDEKLFIERLKDIQRRIVYDNSLPTFVSNGSSSYTLRANKRLKDVVFTGSNDFKILI